MFADAHLNQKNNRYYITYRTGNTVYEECFMDGDLYACGWNPAGYDPNTVTVPGSYRLNGTAHLAGTAFGLEAAGQDLFAAYEWKGYEKTEENGVVKVEIRLQNRLVPLQLTVHTHLDQTDILVRFLTVTNLSNQPILLSGLTVMSGGVLERQLENNQQSPPFEVGYIHNGQGTFEGDFHWQPLPRGSFSFGKQLYTDRYRNPFFGLRSLVSPHLLVGELAFSGGYEFAFHNVVESFSCVDHLSFECRLGTRNPVYVLAAGEQMVTPAMHIGMVYGDWDVGVQALHQHVFAYCDGYEKHRLVEASIGPEVDMCQENVMHAIEVAADVGAEVFFIDAGWYSPHGGECDWPAFTGDWNPKTWRYDCSMEDFRLAAAQHGMKFGLWMDVEKMGPKSRVLQDASIPKLTDYRGNMTMDGQSGILDVADKVGADWAFEQICSVIDRYHLDFFRLDSGSYSYTSYKTVDGGRENRDLRYYNAFYDLFRRLREKYPHVVFQNCAGGGARLDLGLMQVMSNTWITDCQIAPRSFPVINGVSMMLPPAYLVRPIGAQNGHLEGTLDFQLNVARFGNPLFCYVLPHNIPHNPVQLDKIRTMLTTYKTIIRPMLQNARVFHHTPDLDITKPGCVGVLEMASADQTASLVGVFTLSSVEQPTVPIRMKGIAPQGRYRVTVNDEFYGWFDGYTLCHQGILADLAVPLDSKAILAVREDKNE